MTPRLDVACELEIRNLVARYPHYADAGDTERFAALFCEDGRWRRENVPPAAQGGSGLPAETHVGHAAIREMIEASIIRRFNRRFRHQMTDLLVEAGAGPDEATGRCRALITDWRDGPGKIAMCGHYSFVFRRTASGWRFAEVSVYVLPD